MKTFPLSHPAWVEIDLQQFKKNLSAIRHFMGRTPLCLPAKSNAYGHGLIPIAKAAGEVGIDYMAVSCLEEGRLLRQAGIQIPILVMGAIHEAQIAELLHFQLELSISSRYKAELVAEQCQKLQKKCRVHVEVDTGMQRTGVRVSSALTLLNALQEMHCFEIVGVYSHLATSENPDSEIAHQQIRSFKSFIENELGAHRKNLLCHIANSGGVSYYPESHLDMVRPGKLAFGYFKFHQEKVLPIEPVLSLKAKIAYFKVVEKDQGISYGHTYVTPEDTRIVTVPVGYGDGYRRALSNKGEVLIRGKRYPIVGNVCMDQFMVNIGKDEAYVGDEVVLIGKQGDQEITLCDLAAWCNTIPSEIACGLNARLPHLYKEDGRQFYEVGAYAHDEKIC